MIVNITSLNATLTHSRDGDGSDVSAAVLETGVGKAVHVYTSGTCRRLTDVERRVLKIAAAHADGSSKGVCGIASLMHSIYGGATAIHRKRFRSRHSTIGRIVRRLEQRGLLVRTEGLCWSGVKLTGAGRALIEGGHNG